LEVTIPDLAGAVEGRDEEAGALLGRAAAERATVEGVDLSGGLAVDLCVSKKYSEGKKVDPMENEREPREKPRGARKRPT
jgi:hypothetical protein